MGGLILFDLDGGTVLLNTEGTDLVRSRLGGRDPVLMRCGPAFGLDGEPSTGAAQNRVLLDGLTLPGLEAAAEPDGLLHLRLRQEFEPSGGGTQRIETEVWVGGLS